MDNVSPGISAEFKALGRDIQSINEQLSNATTLARLDEEAFKEIFLPMFFGVEESKLHPHAKMGAWIACAGGVYNEVEIVDTNNEPLFKVPPVKLQLPVDYQRDRRQSSLLSEVQMARLHGARHPKHGEEYLKKVLDSYVVDTKELQDVVGYLTRWNDIFKRYGYPGFTIPGVNASNNTAEERAAPDEVEVLL
jgi:hypothetical protein